MARRRPTVQELDRALENVVKWKRFALYLRGIDETKIENIDADNKRDDVCDQKIALYTKWLKVCPDASWEDVIAALEAIHELTLAKKLKEKYLTAGPSQTPTVAALEKSTVRCRMS